MTADAAPWVQTFSGGAVDLLSPTPEQIRLVDIAHALSRIARFNGHIAGPLPWSVASHSLLVESLLPADAGPVLRLHALLHDAHEAYLGDVPTPVKRALTAALDGFARYDPNLAKPVSPADAGLPYGPIADRLDAAVWAAFALPVSTAAETDAVHAADMLALRIERDALMASPPRPWAELPEPPEPLPELPTASMPDVVKAVFVERVRRLVDERHGVA